MNWGTRLTLAILAFMVFMAIIVIYSFRQELNMVTDNYYEKDMRYQEQIEKKKNASMLIEKPKVFYRSFDKIIFLQFPEKILHNSISGEIHLFRPSDHKMDKSFKIALDHRGTQFIDASKFSKGEWIVKLSWKDHHQEYYDEVNIFVR